MTRFLIGTYITLMMLGSDIRASLPEYCRANENAVAFSSTTTLGFSAEQLLDNLTLSRTRCLTWENYMVTRGSISFLPTSNFALVTTYPDKQDCMHSPESMSIDGILHIRSNDQVINARWPARLSAIDSSAATIEIELKEISEYQGFPSPQPYEIVPTTYLKLKFEGAHIDGIMYRLSGTPVPCTPSLALRDQHFVGREHLIL